MSTYPRYSICTHVASDCYEITRWDDAGTWTVVQTNLLTYKKAHRALAEWRAREGIHERLRALAAMEADMHAINIKLERDFDA